MIGDASEWVVPLFPEEEIPHILSALLRCLNGFYKLDPLDKETSLTKRLLKRLKADQKLRDRPVWPDREAIHDDDVSGNEGRLDLRFMLLDAKQKPPPYFAIEAKRLHVTFKSGWESLASKYVSHHQGMMCFIDGRYSKGLRFGGMLGYVFDGDVTKAASLISNQLLTNREKLRLKLPHVLEPSRESTPDTVWQTSHQIDGRTFKLFHILAAV